MLFLVTAFLFSDKTKKTYSVRVAMPRSAGVTVLIKTSQPSSKASQDTAVNTLEVAVIVIGFDFKRVWVRVWVWESVCVGVCVYSACAAWCVEWHNVASSWHGSISRCIYSSLQESTRYLISHWNMLFQDWSSNIMLTQVFSSYSRSLNTKIYKTRAFEACAPALWYVALRCNLSGFDLVVTCAQAVYNMFRNSPPIHTRHRDSDSVISEVRHAQRPSEYS